MMTKTLKPIIILVVSLLIACTSNDKKTKIPEGVITPDEMALIFRDIHLTDALLSRKQYKVNKDYKDVNGFYKDIYEKHGYTRGKFDSSLMFYSDNPFVLDAIYEDVLTELSKMVDTIAIKE